MSGRDSFRSQLGPFAMVPVWVLRDAKDAQAVYLYAILSRYANRERRAWPKHDRLAAEMGVTDRSVRRALARLKAIHAVQTSPHRRADGTVDGTEYLLVAVPDDQRTQVSGSPVKITIQPQPVVAAAAPDTRLPDTNVRPDRTPVSGAYKEELDPSNQIQEHTPCVPFSGRRFEVPRFLHERFVKQLGDVGLAIFDLRGWYARLDAQSDGPIVGTVASFIERAFAAESKRVLGPNALGSPLRLHYADWTCPHTPRCLHPTRCDHLRAIAAEKAQASA
jgi:hypothetical protein